MVGAVSMGTGVMIGAGIFALTGQVAELAHEWFPFAFLGAAGVTAFSAYAYVKVSNAYPSAGGIAMFLEKAYGKTTKANGLKLPTSELAGVRTTHEGCSSFCATRGRSGASARG